MSTLVDLRQTRLDKLQQLEKLGISPYPAKAKKDASNQNVVDHFDRYQDKKLSLSGRIMSFRRHGGITFAHIQDQSGQIQVFIKKTDLEPTSQASQTIGYDDLKLLDIGDFIEVTGSVSKTTSGEVSIIPGSIKLLAKSLRPLPEKWQGLQDRETIFRRRYLDLVMSASQRQFFIRKAKFWDLNRQFLKDKGFIEVETPVMELVTGGADAKPFITHHNALDQDFFLRISTELYQKRLIGGGFEKIFTLGPNFRNEGIDDEHLQEYYQCEWYWAYADYVQNMSLVEEMFKYIAKNLYGKSVFTKGKHTFDLDCDWPRVSYGDLIKKRFSVDIFKDSEDKIISILKQQKISTEGLINRARIVDNLWKIIRSEISGPIFVIDEPKFTSPLAKSRQDNPDLTERFHLIIAGSELGNGYSELNDPQDQLNRFREQQKNRDAGDEESQMLDIDFVEMLEYGMPPTSGWGHSERVFWFLENVSAREGTFFPQMKYDLSDETRKIYGLAQKTSSEDSDDGIGIDSKKVIIGQIQLVKDHPNADTLKIWTVKLSDHQQLDIISSCPNIKPGDIVAVALVGAIVNAPDNKTLKIKKTKMRGVESPAMMCSPLELGVGDDHTTVFVLPLELSTYLGEPVSRHFNVNSKN